MGTSAYDEISEVLKHVLEGKRETVMEPLDRLPPQKKKRLITTGGHYAYLKIAEGCDKHCTYCVIPSIRGHYRSVPMEELLEEAQALVRDGVRELILVAQETTLYGVDLYGKKQLHSLLKALCRIPELVWIRILYCYPEEITPELIQTIREEPKICHYLDLPIQHCSDGILKRMGRKTDKAGLVRQLQTLRREVPDIAIRTTLITGFPGETEEQFQELLEFVDQAEFDRLGVFTYSPEENTPAAEMEDQIPENIKERRRDELMALQQEIVFEKCESMKGRELLVMIEGSLPEEGVYVGRTYRDAPEVDGYIFVQTDETLVTGDLIRVVVTEAAEYDLIGVPV